jgi:glucokinase
VILAGDIGGTNTRLALFAAEGGHLEAAAEATYPSRNYSGLDAIVTEFVKAQQFPVTRAGFGVAGPVCDARCQATNLPWVVDTRQLADQLGLVSVVLINDVEANAYGIATLGTSDLAVLHAGRVNAQGNAAVVSPGTGLGEAGLYWDGSHYLPFATEGGHASFAPNDEFQDDLLRYLRREFGHVSWERVLSGPGLFNIYKWLRDTGRGPEPPWLATELQKGDPPAVISRIALAGQSVLCAKVLDLFVTLLGSEAGNFALKVIATGGLYLGGGIAPKILSKLGGAAFRESFIGKGRMRPVLEEIPIRVILNDKAALRGAAHCAALHG